MVESSIYLEQRNPSTLGRDIYCPECGQPLSLRTSVPLLRPERSRWWGVLAIAMGLCLVATYVIPDGGPTQTQNSPWVVSIGLAAILTGCGVFARQRLKWDNAERIWSGWLRLWTFGEDFFLALFGLSLAGFGVLLALQLGAGTPLTWVVARQTFDRFFEILVYAARFAAPSCPCSW